ncbi:MAG: hypothetical protein JJ913_14500 [Rhizobiaceae bacterium]|nr:hypothetical protein [Rhizobiaceae bacterium]
MKPTVVLITSALALAGCATSGGGGSGSLVGSFAGGNRPASAGLAAIGNGLIGGSVGTSLAPEDRRLALEAEYLALEHTPAGRPVSWKGTNGDATGEVVANQPYRVGSQDCRQYAHTLVTSGRSQTVRGSACRNEDGSWTPLI